MNVALQPSTATEIRHLDVAAYVVPTDRPEADGTLEWEATTIVVVEATAGECTGIGYTYADVAAARLIESTLREVVVGIEAMAVPAAWEAMVRRIRNLGRPGICSAAIAAVDIALWDLKARLLDLPLAVLLGPVRDAVPVYGSGGFTSYGVDELQAQLAEWVAGGIDRVKMKVGASPHEDPARVRAARAAVGEDAELMVDANGAYTRTQALAMAEASAESGVTWFEEPVSSDDLEGLRMLRERAPAGMAIAAGEYGYDLAYFRRMLEAGSVDVLQADVTRCAGITELLRVSALCQARSLGLSTHTAPAVHAHAGVALAPVVHLEYFHDHVRVERMLFDGAPGPDRGLLRPDTSRPGLGLELRRSDAERYAV
ncbi:MAG: enolase C-terminal domain-like protein [Thermoleophilaceae bacterium]